MNTFTTHIAFIGGGNMSSAIIGGLLKTGTPTTAISVVEPFDEARASLLQRYGITALAEAGETLHTAQQVVWAVKPQVFKEAAMPCKAFTGNALHLSVAAGIPSDSIAAWLGTQRVVRSMPNTPALIGQGMTALFARPGVATSERQQIEQLLAPTGQLLWVDKEDLLDAVTALSGSGPAYVFYFLEAMVQAGVEMGLSPAQARQLAVQTFAGASQMAATATEPLETLRARVTSKGGTTYAALTVMEERGMKNQFIEAMQAAQTRAQELGQAFGG